MVAVSKKIKLEHIALAAGLSKVTVSRALSDPDKVKIETRNKILGIAEQMGYFSNSINIKPKANKLIGIVNPDMSNPFFGELAKIMTKISSELEYDILIFDSYESEDIETKSIQRMISYGVDAIILSVISSDRNYNPDYLQKLKSLNIPVILIDREIGNSEYSGIYIDNLHCGTEIANYINQLKYQDVVVIAGPEYSNVSTDRIRGFTSVIDKTKNVQVFHADFFMDAAYKVTKSYLRTNKANLAFAGINNQISLGILKACIESGLIFKQDFDLFSVDNVPYADIYGFKIPCISHNLYEIAYQAINLAIRSINKPNSDISKIIVRGEVNI
ncbi:LacI family transcriptional regulator [Chelonobacter oris]|uniref:LacI family DNA-binding transcriptional regulator n=1 Tax=Chelonobacter oris TaxID=505317 RepID=UPI00244B1F28|nr:LacI family DNA-binding transcriptional regulator [Chelonobacter oris]MDH2999838.1 LacI family transcriptional regulator [Chelonobacter oris]